MSQQQNPDLIQRIKAKKQQKPSWQVKEELELA